MLALGSDDVFEKLDAEARVDARMRQARAAVLAACKAARQSGAGASINQLSTRVTKFRDPEGNAGIAAIDEPLQVYRAARIELERLTASTNQAIERARAGVGDELRRTARDPLIREALTWQNREVVHTVLDEYLERTPAESNAKTRKWERLIARYLQRYTVKNDSIGFFGPTVFGEVDTSVDALELVHGDGLVARRVHRFEAWAITALATHLSSRPEVQPIFTPRLKPMSWLEDDQFISAPPTPPRPLTKTDAFLLRAADGRSTAREIAAAAAADPAASGLATVPDAYAALAQLGKFGFINWDLDVPSHLDDSATWLRQELEKLEDPDSRAAALAPLERMERGLAAVAGAAGDPVALDAAIEALEHEFHTITGMASKRGHGKVYASRQLFYEDCTRDMSFKIGRRVIDDLAGPLQLLLQCSRWYTYDIATRFRREVRVIYKKLCDEHRQTRIPLAKFMSGVRVLFQGDKTGIPPFVATTKAALQAHWIEIIGRDRLDGHHAVVRLTSEELRARVLEVFAAPSPGWPRARYAAPDIMLAARDVAAIEKGEYIAVLGELHSGVNTHLARSAFRMHPDMEAVKAAYDADMEAPCIEPVPVTTDRASHQSVSDRDVHVELSWGRSWRPRDQVHAGGDLLVEADGERLLVRTRSGSAEYGIVAFMEQMLGATSMQHFHILGDRPHVPRVMIDNLVVSREQWTIQRADFEHLLVEAPDVVAKVARWSRRLDLPRFVFGKVPNEPKPFFVDFASPILVEIFLRYLAEAPSVRLSELLPDLDGLWLTDTAGEHYTSELRFVAVDPVAGADDGVA